ncbi:hypothetical protein B0H34DRAFT_736321 [Crassisporium funariophilum]|nr:hypothetical protein B0H34DRAFT_736321 [Crassisporium funariophilum]
MNTNTTNTTANSGKAGSGFGNKIKGAAEVIHGMGENIRGTMLGAVDTMGHESVNKGDDVATQGRLEVERGKANLGKDSNSRGVGGTSGTHPLYGQNTTGQNNDTIGTNSHTGMGTYAGSNGAGAVDPGTGTHTGVSDVQSGQYGGTSGFGHNQTAQGLGNHTSADNTYSSESTHPSHHRDDAITGVPQGQLHDIQSINQHSQPMSDVGMYGSQEYGGGQTYNNQNTQQKVSGYNNGPIQPVN